MNTRLLLGRHRAAAPESPAPQHAAPSPPGRRRAVVAAGTAVVLGGGAALAAWSVSGDGPGEAQAIDADEIVVDDLATPTAGLYPGGLGSLTLRVQNPLPYPVTLTAVQYGAVTTTGAGACASSHVTPVVASETLGTPIALAKESAFTTVVLPDALRMLTTADDACKGATFSVEVSFTGVSS